MNEDATPVIGLRSCTGRTREMGSPRHWWSAGSRAPSTRTHRKRIPTQRRKARGYQSVSSDLPRPGSRDPGAAAQSRALARQVAARAATRRRAGVPLAPPFDPEPGRARGDRRDRPLSTSPSSWPAVTGSRTSDCMKSAHSGVLRGRGSRSSGSAWPFSGPSPASRAAARSTGMGRRRSP